MPNLEAIPTIEQTYLLNSQLIRNAGLLRDAVITVGGQAVQYWVSYYLNLYGEDLPDQHLITSLDVDYSARKHDVTAIAHALGIDSSLNEHGNPPSIAKFLLIDRITKSIKIYDGRAFSDPEEPKIANTVDVIDWPAGFKFGDFDEHKLLLNTEPFWIELPEQEGPVMHEKVRVLNPIACMRSRFANLEILHRPPDIEIARINALKIPCFFFIMEMFDRRSFKEAREHCMSLYALAWDKKFLSLQARYDDVKPDISILPILERLHRYLIENSNDYEIPEKFLTLDLPNRLKQLRARIERHIVLKNRNNRIK